MCDTEDERPAELETLEAIYGSSLNVRSDFSECLELPVASQQPLQVKCTDHQDRPELKEVSHLPPLHILFSLPRGYPNELGPTLAVEAFRLLEKISRGLEATGRSL